MVNYLKLNHFFADLHFYIFTSLHFYIFNPQTLTHPLSFNPYNTPTIPTTPTDVPMAEIRQGTMALRIEPYNLRFESS